MRWQIDAIFCVINPQLQNEIGEILPPPPRAELPNYSNILFHFNFLSRHTFILNPNRQSSVRSLSYSYWSYSSAVFFFLLLLYCIVLLNLYSALSKQF